MNKEPKGFIEKNSPLDHDFIIPDYLLTLCFTFNKFLEHCMSCRGTNRADDDDDNSCSYKGTHIPAFLRPLLTTHRVKLGREHTFLIWENGKINFAPTLFPCGILVQRTRPITDDNKRYISWMYIFSFFKRKISKF